MSPAQTPSQPLPAQGNVSGEDPTQKPTLACYNCRKKKVKCTGGSPCRHCSKRGLRCVIPEGDQKRVYSASKIADMERRLAQYENQPSAESTASPRPISIGRSATSAVPLFQDQGGIDARSQSSPRSIIAADALLSTSNAFGARVTDLLIHTPQESERQPRPSQKPHPSPQDLSPTAHQQSISADKPHSHSTFAPPLPSETEAVDCLHTLNVQIGRTQHHIDYRDFLDRVAQLYSNDGEVSRFKSPWYLEIYLVCAIAKLFTGNFDGKPDRLPGIDYFNYVHRNLPILSDLHSDPRLGIELLALVAVYLQNTHRKEEAYVYISTSMRIAVSHGLHRAGAAGRRPQSKDVHLNRLWWTVYMQERRLSAATGNPPGINDESVTAALPTDSYGFTSVAPLLMNISIARITGKIIRTLYGSGRHEEAEFVPNVQEIVRNLLEIAQELPQVPEAADNCDNATLKDSATLHLSLYQALILTLRPIMLHVAQLILRGDGLNGRDLDVSSLGRLSRTCSEAATRLLRVLTALRQRQMIGIFGFWDFDGIHCAAFIMILAAIYDSVCKEGQKMNPAPAMLSAFELMQYLIDRGNSSVLPKLEELQKTWDRLQTNLRHRHQHQQSSSTTSGGRVTQQDANASQDQGHPPFCPTRSEPGAADHYQNPDTPQDLSSINVMTDMQQTATQWQYDAGLTDLWSEISHLCLPPNTHEGATMAGLPIDEYYNYCTSLYNSPRWAYLGEEFENFAELDRHMNA